LVPNALGPVIIAITVGFGEAMLLESSLSYLGIGIQPPGASWGQMISESLDQWRYSPHLVAVPGIVLAIAVLGFNLLGDGLNDALDPRRRR
jgi:ABC-type dipeptide/oligopeptide/nickel transport system permease subunit